MNLETSHFDQLPFPKLFRDFVTGHHSISEFFESGFPEQDSIVRSINQFNFNGDREQIVSLLKEFNLQFDPGNKTLAQVDKLLNPDSLAVVTGQQVSLMGGPLFTIYKTITAIIYARRLHELTGRPVVPVFWLADEDHDIEEVSTIKLAGSSDPVSVIYNHNNYPNNPPPAGLVQLGDEFDRFKREVIDQLDDTDFSDKLWREFSKCYDKKRTFTDGFGRWLLKIFDNEGLVLSGSYNQGIKEYSKSLFKTAVVKLKEITKTLDATTDRLINDGYHGQVQVQSSNLFYLDKNNYRQKIKFDDNEWRTNEKKWSSYELLNEIEDHPQRFSPNVFLRPIMQDHFLPVAAYVGGPGEIAYYAQMKEFFHIFDKKMPPIIPRFSVTLVESAIDRIINKLPFNWTDYQQRIEDLEKMYVEKSEDVDIEKLFGSWKAQIEEISLTKSDEIRNIDQSLDATVGKAKAVYFSELDNLKGKVYRSIKEQEKIQLDRILRIKQNLFPNGRLQERDIAFIYFMNKYGLHIWDDVLDLLEDEEPFTHKKIYL